MVPPALFQHQLGKCALIIKNNLILCSNCRQKFPTLRTTRSLATTVKPSRLRLKCLKVRRFRSPHWKRKSSLQLVNCKLRNKKAQKRRALKVKHKRNGIKRQMLRRQRRSQAVNPTVIILPYRMKPRRDRNHLEAALKNKSPLKQLELAQKEPITRN